MLVTYGSTKYVTRKYKRIHSVINYVFIVFFIYVAVSCPVSFLINGGVKPNVWDDENKTTSP